MMGLPGPAGGSWNSAKDNALLGSSGNGGNSFLSEVCTSPYGSFPDHIDMLPRDYPIVCYCKSGSRSLWAALFLQD